MKVAIVYMSGVIEAVFASLEEANAYRNDRASFSLGSGNFSVREMNVYETAKERMLIDAKNKLTSGEFSALYNDILESEAKRNTPAAELKFLTPAITGVGLNEQEMLHIRRQCGCGVQTSAHQHCWNCGCAMMGVENHWSITNSRYTCEPRRCASAYGLKQDSV